MPLQPLTNRTGLAMIIDILRHTPPWVFVVLALLVVLGVRRLRANALHPRQLLILPVVMTALSAFGLWQVFGANTVAVAAWIAVFAAALAVGWSLSAQDGVQYSATTNRIHVPGSALPLVLMMTIFFLRYGVAVSLAIDPALRTQTFFVAAVGAAYGCSSGCFAARALRTWRSAFRGHAEPMLAGAA
jgi:hypothetical protein